MLLFLIQMYVIECIIGCQAVSAAWAVPRARIPGRQRGCLQFQRRPAIILRVEKPMAPLWTARGSTETGV